MHLSTGAPNTSCPRCLILLTTKETLPRDTEKQKHLQSALNSGKCHSAWCSKASHPIQLLCPLEQVQLMSQRLMILSLHGGNTKVLINLVYSLANKLFHDIQLNLFLCIQYLAAHPVLLGLASTLQHIINHGRKKLFGLAWFSLL